MPHCDGGVLLCTRGFNPIDVLVEDALVGGPPDTGDTVEAFTDFIDRLLTRLNRPHTSQEYIITTPNMGQL
tara:strand:- start:250 stop:462 length:213 start_codon:yes stop_codon:yes gene_type:complete